MVYCAIRLYCLRYVKCNASSCCVTFLLLWPRPSAAPACVYIYRYVRVGRGVTSRIDRRHSTCAHTEREREGPTHMLTAAVFALQERSGTGSSWNHCRGRTTMSLLLLLMLILLSSRSIPCSYLLCGTTAVPRSIVLRTGSLQSVAGLVREKSDFRCGHGRE